MRIILARCHETRQNERANDIVRSLFVAEEQGMVEAHRYLVKLAQEAEEGKYQEAFPWKTY
jgi:hypothetical protein